MTTGEEFLEFEEYEEDEEDEEDREDKEFQEDKGDKEYEEDKGDKEYRIQRMARLDQGRAFCFYKSFAWFEIYCRDHSLPIR